MFSEDTVRFLKYAGWSATRDFQTTVHEQILDEAGYRVFPVVQDFLRQFGGLRIRYRYDFRGTTIYTEFHFDVESAVDGWSSEFLPEFEEMAGGKLCLIGESNNCNSVLMMDEQGRVYCGSVYSKYYLKRIADSGADAVEFLCTWRPRA
jgi:hypothetical protein